MKTTIIIITSQIRVQNVPKANTKKKVGTERSIFRSTSCQVFSPITVFGLLVNKDGDWRSGWHASGQPQNLQRLFWTLQRTTTQTSTMLAYLLPSMSHAAGRFGEKTSDTVKAFVVSVLILICFAQDRPVPCKIYLALALVADQG
jgi:hypothetical protein